MTNARMAVPDVSTGGSRPASAQGAGVHPGRGERPAGATASHGTRATVIGRRRGNLRSALAALALGGIAAGPVAAADAWRICLNWAPGADHAPLYLAREQGMFAEADLAVDLRPGGGSADAVGKVQRGECEAAVADFGAVVSAWRAGRDVVAVFAVFADAPLAFVARAPARLERPAELAGMRVASDEKELARRLWPEFARRNGLDPGAVTWVQTPNNAKVDALRAGTADAAAHTFYHHMTEFSRAFGSSLVVMPYRDYGINPYTQVVAVSVRTVDAHPARVSSFVRVLRAAHRGCVVAPDACVLALTAANPHLDPALEREKWAVASPLVQPAGLAAPALGRFDADRVKAHHGPEAAEAFTNRFVDTADGAPR